MIKSVGKLLATLMALYSANASEISFGFAPSFFKDSFIVSSSIYAAID